jgi:CheY-like chemotaxis protein
VEDNTTTRLLTKHMLELEGWTVREAENGRVALNALAHHRPDLILLDLMMPEMDGFAFLTELQNHADWRAIPVVIVTATELTTENQRWLNGRVEKILHKSAHSQDELLSTIRQLLASCVPIST